VNYKPLGVAGAVGIVDGIINPSGDSAHVIPHGHLLFRLAVLGAGFAGERWGGWDKNISQGMIVSSAALLTSRLPAALNGGGIAAFGERVTSTGDRPTVPAAAATVVNRRIAAPASPVAEPIDAEYREGDDGPYAKPYVVPNPSLGGDETQYEIPKPSLGGGGKGGAGCGCGAGPVHAHASSARLRPTTYQSHSLSG
jgi:hypothetical protein